MESAEVLLRELEGRRTVSDALRLKLLQRMKSAYEVGNMTGEPYYKEILSRISKVTRKAEESNSSRHQRTKELRAQEKQVSKRAALFREQPSIAEENEEEER